MYKIELQDQQFWKTTIANIFARFNIPIFDADREIKNIKNKKIKQTKIYGPLLLKKDYIDKLKLREIIFSNNFEKKNQKNYYILI